MSMDGIMLGFVARELKEKLLGGRVDRVLQPERDELHLLLRANGENYRLLLSSTANAARVHLSQRLRTAPQEAPMFCMLLRKHLSGSRLSEIRQIAGDRILEITFDTRNELGDPAKRTLIVEMMGRYSNIIFTDQGGQIIDAARHVGANLSRVRQILPGLTYTFPPTQNKLNPNEANAESIARHLSLEHSTLEKAILHTLTGFSPQSAAEAAFRICGREDTPVEGLDMQKIALALVAYIAALPKLGPCIITLSANREPFDVFPFPQRHLALPWMSFTSPSVALEAFFGERDRMEHMKQRTAGMERLIRSHIERCERKISLQEDALTNAAHMEEYRKNGELLQANLYRISRGATYIDVEDYYTEGMPIVRIPLNTALSPAMNAQRCFKLYQKARGASRLAAEQKAKTQQELLFFEQMEDDLRKAETEQDLTELRRMLEHAGYAKSDSPRSKPRKEASSAPMRFLTADGTLIEVGRNAVQNERLTLGASGEEFWLHAQRMPGSHVIVHNTTPSEEILATAAVLAAYYSKGVRSANVPVDVTQRKYVKKPGGTPQGFVTYTHQQTLYVTPTEAQIRKISRLS